LNFTVVFKSSESKIYTYGLVFIPTVCWIDGDSKDNILFNSGSTTYKLGYVKELIKVIDDRETSSQSFECFENLNKENKSCVVVVNNVGHADERALELLVEDLSNEGFRTQVVYV
jgi:hypothetical protein